MTKNEYVFVALLAAASTAVYIAGFLDGRAHRQDPIERYGIGREWLAICLTASQRSGSVRSASTSRPTVSSGFVRRKSECTVFRVEVLVGDFQGNRIQCQLRQLPVAQS
jgi:hypothetical protein